jgi:hypothetical protein
MTPLLTLSLLTGSYFAMSQLAKGMTSDQSLNKAQDVATPNLGATNYNQGVNGYGMQSSLVGGIGTNAYAAEHSATYSVQSGVGAATNAANQKTLSATASQSVAAETALNTLSSIMDNHGSKQGLTNQLGTGTAEKLSNDQKKAYEWGSNHGLSHTQTQSVLAALSAGGGVNGEVSPLSMLETTPGGKSALDAMGKAFGFTMKAGVNGQMKADFQGNSKAEVSHFLKNGTTHANSLMHDASLVSGLTATNGIDSAQMETLNKSLADVKKYGDARKKDAAQAESFSTSNNASTQEGTNFSGNGSSIAGLIRSNYFGGAAQTSAAESLGNNFSGNTLGTFHRQAAAFLRNGLSPVQAYSTAFANTAAALNEQARQNPEKYGDEAGAVASNFQSVVFGAHQPSGLGDSGKEFGNAQQQTGHGPSLQGTTSAGVNGAATAATGPHIAPSGYTPGQALATATGLSVPQANAAISYAQGEVGGFQAVMQQAGKNFDGEDHNIEGAAGTISKHYDAMVAKVAAAEHSYGGQFTNAKGMVGGVMLA